MPNERRFSQIHRYMHIQTHMGARDTVLNLDHSGN